MIFLSTYPIEANVMASVRLRHLLRFLSGQNRKVFLICPEGTQSSLEVLPGISIQSIPRVTKWSYVFRAAKEITRLVQKNSSEIIVASIPGVQSFMAAVLARFLSHTPFRLILEIRDPFSLNPALPWSIPKRAIGGLMESILLKKADRVIFLTAAIQSMYVNGFPGPQRWKTNNTVITNGYSSPTTDLFKKEERKPLTLTYTGHFYDRRSPVEFLTVLRDYLDSHPDTPMPRIQIAGEINGNALQQQVKSLCNDSRLQKCVYWLGTVPHNEAIRLTQNSDINLLITHDQGSEYAIPGKLFEYMRARRPVLAITRDPLVKKIMTETNLGWVCEDRSAIAQWLGHYLSNAQSLTDWKLNEEAISAYRLENIYPRWLNFVEQTP